MVGPYFLCINTPYCTLLQPKRLGWGDKKKKKCIGYNPGINARQSHEPVKGVYSRKYKVGKWKQKIHNKEIAYIIYFINYYCLKKK